ncbi:MAG TPA: NAD(+) diphosphatase [Solirubrobacteraceae bacterium]|jgi:NAD+ diphosphatase
MAVSEHARSPRPFTGMALDRASVERKDPEWVSGLIENREARAVLGGRDGVVIDAGSHPELLRTRPSADHLRQPILLGLDDGRPLFAVDLDGLGDGAASTEGDGVASADGARVISLRDAGTLLPHPEAGLAAYLTALLNWHRRHRFCANCGAATEIAEAGYSRHCPRCGATHFPRTDPVVIMTVEHRDRLLLGRRAGWPAGRLSVLAGFVSPGESAEEAVVREVQEESGIVARDPVFVSSQPWPFPASLMLGFHAVADGGEPQARDDELDEVHWLDLEAVKRAIRDENPDFKLPPAVSIARFLIEHWVALKSTDGSE